MPKSQARPKADALPVVAHAQASLPGGAPLYASVKRMILARIQNGEWAPGTRVPSENELVAEFGVSKMTANRALRELGSEGVLVRIQGSGSFVAERKGHSALFEVRNIAEEIVERGHSHSAHVVLLQAEAASPEVSDALELPIGARVFHSVVLHHENEVPVQVEDRFVNPAAAPEYLGQDFTRTTPNAYLTRVAPLAIAEHVVEAVLPQPWECKLLAIARAEPCLMIKRRTWSGATTVTAVRLLCPGSRYRLEGRFNERAGGG